MYDPLVGQWISEDPIGFEAGDANVRRYVGNQQLMFVDPTGLEIVFEATGKGTADDVTAMYALLDELRKSSNAVVKNYIVEMDKSATQFVFKIDRNDATILIADAEKKTIDVGDFYQLPDDGPITKLSTLFHELVEQKLLSQSKATNPIKRFRDCHGLASDAEVKVSGYNRITDFPEVTPAGGGTHRMTVTYMNSSGEWIDVTFSVADKPENGPTYCGNITGIDISKPYKKK